MKVVDWTMKVGDLVKPLQACSGEMGKLRCKIAIITKTTRPNGIPSGKPTILCACGTSERYLWQLEVVSESR